MPKEMTTKELRKEWNLTQDVLADITGIPRNRIAKWEQGKGFPKTNDAEILSLVEKRLNNIKGYDTDSEAYKVTFLFLKYGLRVRAARKGLDYSITDLSTEIDLSEEDILKIENGYENIFDSKFSKLWEFFDIKLPKSHLYEDFWELFKKAVVNSFLDEKPTEDVASNADTNNIDSNLTKSNEEDVTQEEEMRLLKVLHNKYGDDYNFYSGNPIALYISSKYQEKYVKSFMDSKFLGRQLEYSLTPETSYTGAIWRYFELPFENMLPEIKKDDIGLFTLVNVEDYSYLYESRIYLVLTEEKFHFGRTFNLDDNLLIFGDNPKINNASLINYLDITEVWELRRIITKPNQLIKASVLRELKNRRQEILKNLQPNKDKSSE